MKKEELIKKLSEELEAGDYYVELCYGFGFSGLYRVSIYSEKDETLRGIPKYRGYS